MKKKDLEKTDDIEAKIHKDIILRNYMKYDPDKGLLVSVLSNASEEGITESELLEMIKTEKERVIK